MLSKTEISLYRTPARLSLSSKLSTIDWSISSSHLFANTMMTGSLMFARSPISWSHYGVELSDCSSEISHITINACFCRYIYIIVLLLLNPRVSCYKIQSKWLAKANISNWARWIINSKEWNLRTWLWYLVHYLFWVHISWSLNRPYLQPSVIKRQIRLHQSIPSELVRVTYYEGVIAELITQFANKTCLSYSRSTQ